MAAKESVSIQFNARDAALCLALFDSRTMTLPQAARLIFDGKGEAAKKRLQKLKAAGYVGERRQAVAEPPILFLTRKGFTVLSERGLLSAYPEIGWTALERRLQVSPLTVKHELEIVDLKAAFAVSLRVTQEATLAEFSTWPVLFEFATYHPRTKERVLVKPDGFLRVQEGDFEHTFFLEHDRSTETLETLTTRCACYLEYYRSGGYAERMGADRSAFRDFPFRALVVCKTEERRNNLAEALLRGHPPILTHTWLTTFAEATTDPLDAIWVRPKDYQAATSGTAFDPLFAKPTWGYRRQTERELLVASKVVKHRLLEDGENPAHEKATP